MPDTLRKEIADKTFLTLQGAIGIIVTASFALQGWMLMSVHEIQVQGAKVDQQIVAIIDFNMQQRVQVQDLEVRVRVLETTTDKASADLIQDNISASSGIGSCFNPEHMAMAILRRRRFL